MEVEDHSENRIFLAGGILHSRKCLVSQSSDWLITLVC